MIDENQAKPSSTLTLTCVITNRTNGPYSGSSFMKSYVFMISSGVEYALLTNLSIFAVCSVFRTIPCHRLVSGLQRSRSTIPFEKHGFLVIFTD